jgi:hypothetical protein
MLPGYRAGMKHVLAIAALFAGLSTTSALAQTAEPRLAGAPQRVCTDEEIRQAMDGSYAGEPCRFRQMPEGQAVPRGSEPLEAPSTASGPSRPLPAQMVASSHIRHGSSSSVSGYSSHSADRFAGPAVPVRRSEPVRAETVSLGPDFFSGALVGGVEARMPPLYSYRRIILIDAAGGLQLAGPGTGLVYTMDRQARPPQLNQPAGRRVYPAY